MTGTIKENFLIWTTMRDRTSQVTIVNLPDSGDNREVLLHDVDKLFKEPPTL